MILAQLNALRGGLMWSPAGKSVSENISTDLKSFNPSVCNVEAGHTGLVPVEQLEAVPCSPLSIVFA